MRAQRQMNLARDKMSHKDIDNVTLLLLLPLLFVLTLVPQGHAHYHLGKEKVTHLHFFYSERVTGDKPTIVLSGKPENNASADILTFGALSVIDTPLTEGEDPNSKVLGHAQGLVVSAGQDKTLLVFAVDFELTSAWHAAVVAELYSASVVDKAITFCFLEDHVMMLSPMKKIFPEVEYLNSLMELVLMAMTEPGVQDQTHLDLQNQFQLSIHLSIQLSILCFHFQFPAKTILSNFLQQFSGSSISVLSRNPILDVHRELAVVGGRGKFRMARGFAILRLVTANADVNIIEYNVTVFHYK